MIGGGASPALNTECLRFLFQRGQGLGLAALRGVLVQFDAVAVGVGGPGLPARIPAKLLFGDLAARPAVATTWAMAASRLSTSRLMWR